jgi:hypothetical protein
MSKVLQTTVIEIEGMLEGLREKHSTWMEQQHTADTTLYALLDGCLDFYRLLKTDEDCFAAFKELGCVKWNKRTRVATMVVKAIFGSKAKKSYAYAKALEAAFNADIGKKGTLTMTHWLNDNGGINGVIRRRSSISATQAARAHAISVGKNAQAYGITGKGGTFTSAFIDKAYSNANELVLLCKYDKATQQTHIIWATEKQDYVDDLYADAGECIMKQAVYTNNRLRVHKQQAAKKVAATEKVKASLNNITARVAKAERKAEAA